MKKIPLILSGFLLIFLISWIIRPIEKNMGSEEVEPKIISGQEVTASTITLIYSDGTKTSFSYDDYKAHPIIFEREIASSTGNTMEQIQIFTTDTGFDTKRGVLEITNIVSKVK